MSEVVGVILAFGIMATLTTVAMLGFRSASQDTLERGIEVEAQAVADQVAARLVDVLLFAEAEGGPDTFYDRYLALPLFLEGHDYRIALTAVSTDAVTVDLNVPGQGITVTSEVFVTSGDWEVCDRSGDWIPAGQARIAYGFPADQDGDGDQDCADALLGARDSLYVRYAP